MEFDGPDGELEAGATNKDVAPDSVVPSLLTAAASERHVTVHVGQTVRKSQRSITSWLRRGQKKSRPLTGCFSTHRIKSRRPFISCVADDTASKETVIQAPPAANTIAPAAVKTPEVVKTPEDIHTTSFEKALSATELNRKKHMSHYMLRCLGYMEICSDSKLPAAEQTIPLNTASIYKEQLSKLAALGFSDATQNVHLLEKYEGDLPKTIDELRCLVTFNSMRDKVSTSNASRTIPWGFGSRRTFDRLPTSAPAFAAMIAKSKKEIKRQVVSDLLDFLVSEDRIERFLSHTRDTNPSSATIKPLEKVELNEHAQRGGALYERFLDSMVGHVAELGGVLQTLMGSTDQSIEPFALVFHGTLLQNLPSILRDGMLPEMRLHGGDWFATSPWTSIRYCTDSGQGCRMILFLLLPTASAAVSKGPDVIVMSKTHYELPLCTVDFEYEFKQQERCWSLRIRP